MGVPKALSDQGIVNRYFEQLADRGQGRLTVQANADESFAGILDLAECVDRGTLVDMASVYRRGESKPRYTNTPDGSGQWTAPPALRESIETERIRRLTPTEGKAFVDTQLRLRETSRGLGAEWPQRLARIEQNALPILLPADVQRLTPAARPSAAAARPSAAAARSRSTTTARKPDGPTRGPAQDPGRPQAPGREAPRRRPRR
ncbi:hypothetical protein [Streptomyces globosus]|uniref:hypothetical protein n=1 Tax=Streptomyces globosus TaxID=68209 RepID=UPI002482CB4F|nr:hypothetical protein [Streptomyces globosus]